MTSVVSAGTLIALPHDAPPNPAASPGEDQQPGWALQPPTGTRVFIGRTKELDRLTAPVPEENRPGPLVLVIAGMRTYAAAESRMTSTAALRTLLNALNVPPDPGATDVQALSRAWRAATAGKRMLIVLDDADTAAQIRPLLPAAEESAILITTRHVLVGLDPDRGVTLRPFTRGQAAQLAGTILRRAGLNDPQAVAAIAAGFRLPLAIRQMSDLKAANPAQEIPSAATLPIDDETATAFARSLAALAKPARLVLRRVARYPGSLVSAPIAAVLADRPAAGRRRRTALPVRAPRRQRRRPSRRHQHLLHGRGRRPGRMPRSATPARNGRLRAALARPEPPGSPGRGPPMPVRGFPPRPGA
ncbi:hypothetical protein ACIA8R_46865 [Nonomuraea sp. NPDC051191]|uniref:hypothetical protein n=1 Tax=Nonomuraea sp. NPDC051191 TaxID=3364372 RepID=UPI0037BDAE48